MKAEFRGVNLKENIDVSSTATSITTTTTTTAKVIIHPSYRNYVTLASAVVNPAVVVVVVAVVVVVFCCCCCCRFSRGDPMEKMAAREGKRGIKQNKQKLIMAINKFLRQQKPSHHSTSPLFFLLSLCKPCVTLEKKRKIDKEMNYQVIIDELFSCHFKKNWSNLFTTFFPGG